MITIPSFETTIGNAVFFQFDFLPEKAKLKTAEALRDLKHIKVKFAKSMENPRDLLYRKFEDGSVLIEMSAGYAAWFGGRWFAARQAKAIDLLVGEGHDVLNLTPELVQSAYKR